MNRRDDAPPERSRRPGSGRSGSALGVREAVAAVALPEPSPRKLPRWRGFNLLEMFHAGGDRPFREEDFAWISELGFDFVRLPLDYRCWSDREDWTRLKEDVLKRLDRAVELGKKHAIHVQLNFHRAPGYTVASPPEAKSLWTDSEARDVCALHWSTMARQVQGRPQPPAQLQPVQRAGGHQARGLSRGRGADGPCDPRARPGPADRLRWPRLGAEGRRPSSSGWAWPRPRGATTRST